MEEDEILGPVPRVGPGTDALSVARMRTRVRAIHHGVQRGLLHQSARLVLRPDEAAVAANPAVVERLRALHPEGELGLAAFPAAGRSPAPETDAEALRAAAHSMKPGTSPGLSGWTVSLVRSALGADGMVSYLLRQLTAMKRNEAGGWRLYCASRLTALSKPGGGVRPIAVGEVPYRLLMRTALYTYGERVRSGLLPTQYGVQTPGGTEPVIRAVEHVYQGELQHYQQVTALDFSNAYNTLRRRCIGEAMRRWYGPLYRLTRWAYGQAAPLVVAGPREPDGEERATVELHSSEGVRQGDPLAPLLFSAGIRPYLEQLKAALGPEHLVLAYLDDVFILSKAEGDVVQVAEHVAAESGNGLRLNVAKSHVYTREQLASGGMPILGTVVGGEAARRAFADKMAAELAGSVHRLFQLTELPRQDVLLLLVHCIQQKHRHLQRQLDGTGLAWFWEALDQSLQRAVLRLRGDPDEMEVDLLSRELITLPDRLGGLGIASYAECQAPARATMQETADEILRLSGVLPLYPTPPSEAPGGGSTADSAVNRAEGSAEGSAEEHPEQPPPADVQASAEGTTDGIQEPNEPRERQRIPSQRARCNALFEARQARLLEQLPTDVAVAILEHGTEMGRRYLRTIPFQPDLTLEDRVVVGALRQRTFQRHAIAL